jgi:hypothetical protein
MQKLIPLLLLLIAPVVTGCGEHLLKMESSQAYKDGYNDGCASGSAATNALAGQFTKDMDRYGSDPDYASGWRNGERECNGTDLMTNPNNPFEQRDIDGPDGL